jgi:hypothetical protein
MMVMGWDRSLSHDDADVDPVVLYALVTNQPVPDYATDNERMTG